MNVGAAFLLAVLVGRRTADKEAAVEVNRDHREPVLGRHAVKDLITQHAGVVDDGIEPAEMVERGLHDLLRRTPFGNGIGADGGRAAASLDQLLRLLRRRCRLTLAGQRSPDIIDYDLGSGSGHRNCDLAPNAAASTGDDGDFVFQQAGHGPLLRDDLDNPRTIKRPTAEPVNSDVFLLDLAGGVQCAPCPIFEERPA